VAEVHPGRWRDRRRSAPRLSGRRTSQCRPVRADHRGHPLSLRLPRPSARPHDRGAHHPRGRRPRVPQLDGQDEDGGPRGRRPGGPRAGQRVHDHAPAAEVVPVPRRRRRPLPAARPDVDLRRQRRPAPRRRHRRAGRGPERGGAPAPDASRDARVVPLVLGPSLARSAAGDALLRSPSSSCSRWSSPATTAEQETRRGSPDRLSRGLRGAAVFATWRLSSSGCRASSRSAEVAR
jgi:hypothetical protein